MAKMYGCYEALTGGQCFEGLTTLTGRPVEQISLLGKYSSWLFIFIYSFFYLKAFRKLLEIISPPSIVCPLQYG